ncbi:MAG: DUF2958 domain-containing protein [Halanaerobiales bacterium]
MKLITKKIKEKLPVYEEMEDDPIAYVKFFHPMSNWTWYGCAFDPEREIFTGLVQGHEVEFGDFSLQELKSVKILGLGIERDLHFTPVRISKIKEKINERGYY